MIDQNVADICLRWKAQLDFVYHPDRLKYPLKRVGGRSSSSFERISWDEAMDTVSNDLQKVKDNYGPESVVFYIAYTKEPRPYFHRLAHAFGSPNYCTESSSCFSAAWLAAALTYGEDYGSIYTQSQEVDPASKCKLIWGTAMQASMPWIWKDHLDARKKGLKLIVVDPRRTKIASLADIHLQLRPGTDGALALGLMNVIIDEQLYDREFVEKWTVGFDGLKKLVQGYSSEKVEKITQVPAAKIREAAIMYATQKPAKIGMSADATTHTPNGVQNHRAIILLAALTGNFEVPGGNRQTPQVLPQNGITLHERIDGMSPGLGTDRFPIWTNMFREMESNILAERIESGEPYPIKALFGAGLNPMFFPNSNHLVESLNKLDFIVVTDYFLTPGAQLADIVLPIASWLERQMLFAYPGGKVTLIEPAIEPIGESWPEWKVYFKLAKKLGLGHDFWEGEFEKCLRYALEPSGITLEELIQHPEGIKYPVTPRPAKYYEQAGFKTPSGKVEIASSILAQHGCEPLPVYKEPVESPVTRPDLLDKYPLVLTSGARKAPYTHSLFRNISQLRKMLPEPLLDISPADAQQRSIKSGDLVKVSSPRGEMKITANVTDTILPGVVEIPHLWAGEANVNMLIDDQSLDPISGFPPFKSQLCQVDKSS